MSAALSRSLRVGAALALIGVAWVLFVFEDVVGRLRVNRQGLSDQLLGHGELFQLVVLLVLGLPAAFLLARAIEGEPWERATRWVERGGYWLPSLVAALASILVARLVTQQVWFTDDEQSYLFQAQTYRRFEWTVPALKPIPLFSHPFVVAVEGEGGVHWSGAYPVLQPAMIALSMTLGNPGITQWICVALICHQVGRLAETWLEDRRLAIGAAWLCATSPMLVGLGATYHSSVLACLLSVVTIRALLALLRDWDFKRGLLLGLLCGATLLARPMEGAILSAACGAVLLAKGRAHAKALPRVLSACVLAGAVPFGIMVVANLGTTGLPLRSPYLVLEQQIGKFFGFGPGMMWNRVHTPSAGINQTFTALVRLDVWTFGWPIGLIGPALAATSASLRPRGVGWLLGLSALQLCAYLPFSFGSVHDFGSAYHLWHLPWIALLTVAVLRGAHERWPGVARRAATVAIAMTAVGLALFLPPRVKVWRETSRLILAPVQAAERAAGKDRALVLWTRYQSPPQRTWVQFPPAPFPDRQILWARDAPGAEPVLRALYPDRKLLRLRWNGDVPEVNEVAAAP